MESALPVDACIIMSMCVVSVHAIMCMYREAHTCVCSCTSDHYRLKAIGTMSVAVAVGLNENKTKTMTSWTTFLGTTV